MKVFVDIVAGPMTNIKNKSIQTDHFLNSLNLAGVEQIYKGGSTTEINHHRLVL